MSKRMSIVRKGLDQLLTNYEFIEARIDTLSEEKRRRDIVHKYLQPSNILTYVPKWPLYVFLTGAIFCLSGSAILHTFFYMSESTKNSLMRLDYGGIAAMIYTGTYPPNYYIFACTQVESAKIFFIAVISVCSILVFVLCMMTFFQ